MGRSSGDTARPKLERGRLSFRDRSYPFRDRPYLVYVRVAQALALASAAVTAFAEPAHPPLSPTNIFAPLSTPAQSIFDLSLFVLMVTAAIFVVVFSLLAYAVIKFRRRPANDPSTRWRSSLPRCGNSRKRVGAVPGRRSTNRPPVSLGSVRIDSYVRS